jgi:ribosomal-protein-serine acetyltransferase
MSEDKSHGLELEIDENLKLRQLIPDESNLIFSIVDSEREYLGKWLPWVENTQTPGDSKEFIEGIIQKRQEGTEFGFGIIVNDQPKGHISLMHVSDGKAPEIGYWISSQESGKGITSKAAKTVTEFGFKTLGLDKITIRADHRNIASNKVAEKLGYILTGQEYADTENAMNVWVKSTPI